jgi:hypothetical protein
MAQIEFYSKDIQILRQSQQKMAFDLAQSKGVILTMKELQRMTDVFVECCIKPQNQELKDKIKEMDFWLENKTKK